MSKRITPNRLKGIVSHCLEVDNHLKDGKDFTLKFDEHPSGGQHTVTAEFFCNAPHVYEADLRQLSVRYKFIFKKAPARELQEA